MTGHSTERIAILPGTAWRASAIAPELTALVSPETGAVLVWGACRRMTIEEITDEKHDSLDAAHAALQQLVGSGTAKPGALAVVRV